MEKVLDFLDKFLTNNGWFAPIWMLIGMVVTALIFDGIYLLWLVCALFVATLLSILFLIVPLIVTNATLDDLFDGNTVQRKALFLLDLCVGYYPVIKELCLKLKEANFHIGSGIYETIAYNWQAIGHTFLWTDFYVLLGCFYILLIYVAYAYGRKLLA